MKVLVLTNVPAPYRMEFFNCLGQLCQLTVLFEQSEKEQIHRNQKWFTEKAVSFRAIYLKSKPFLNKTVSCEVLRYLKKTEYDITLVLGYSLPTEILAIFYMFFKKKCFVLGFDGAIEKGTKLPKRLLKRFLIGSASACLSTGELTDAYIKQYTNEKMRIFRIPFSSIHKSDVLPEVLHEEAKEVYKKKLKMSENKIILSVGQFIYRKGYDVLIDAMSNLDSSYGVYIIGDNVTGEYIELCKKYNLSNVHFVGYKSKEELKEYYYAADLFVLPTREDVWGLVINEAMAYGLPIITTEGCVAGMELIKPVSPACIVKTDDAVALARAMNDLFAQNNLSDLGKQNLETIRNWTIEDMAARYLQIFEEILESDEE